MSLLNMGVDFVQSVLESLVSVWNVAEIALDPFSFKRNIEAKALRVSDFGGLVRIA